MFDNTGIPLVLSPPGGLVRSSDVDEMAPIWTGRVKLDLGLGRSAEGEAALNWTWLPEPELRLTARTTEQWSSEMPFHPVSVTADGAQLSLLAAIRQSGPFNSVERVMLLREACVGDSEKTVNRTLLQLLNVPRFLGLPVRSGGSVWAGRIEIDAGEWLIRVDGTSQAPTTDNHRRAGYLVTHSVQITRADGEEFELSSVRPVVESLCWLFSVLRGAYVSPPTWHGLRGDDLLWTLHSTWPVDPWKGDFGVFPTGFVAAEDVEVLPALGRAVVSLLQLRRDDTTREALDRVLLWFATANSGGSPADLVTAQAGLELLAYLELVPAGFLSNQGFDRLTAADQIRLLMRHLDLPVEIPHELTALAAWASGEHATDAPEAISRFRNFTVHPPTRRRPDAAKDLEVVTEARTLALSVLERVMLAHVGYDALIQDRHRGWQMGPIR